MRNYIKPIIEMIETHTTLLSGSGFTPGEPAQSDGCYVTKGDPKHSGEDNL